MGRGKCKTDTIFKITQYQPNDCVTSSSIMVEVSDVCILFDLGLQQDSSLTFPQLYHSNMQKLRSIPYDRLTHVCALHCHLDHFAGLGVLVREETNFNGDIIATELTAELGRIIMQDAQRINQSDVTKWNSKEAKKYRTFYDKEDIQTLMDRIKCYSYDTVIRLSDTVDLVLKPACHISGGAMAYLTYHGDNRDYHLLYTSDITYGHSVERPFTMRINEKETVKADVVIMESTYGLREENKPSCSADDPIDFLEKVILEEVVGKNQTLWIPSFAVHRATSLYYYIYKIFERNADIKKANIPVYFCGQMMQEAHKVIGKDYYNDYYDEIWHDEKDIWRKEPFGFLTQKKDVEHFCLNNGRKIVISSNGMFDKGYSSILADSYVANKKVSCLCCGYQGGGTLGQLIRDGAEYANVNGINKKVRLKYCGTIPNLSGHASHQGLIDFASKHLNQHALKNIILVHGDDDAKEQLKEDLEKVLAKDKKVTIIKQFETLKI